MPGRGAPVTAPARPSGNWRAPNRCWRCLPGPYPATVIVSRTVGANAAVAFRGNSYSVPPGLAGAQVQRRCRLGTGTLEICSAAGVVLAGHRLAPDGADTMVRQHLPPRRLRWLHAEAQV